MPVVTIRPTRRVTCERCAKRPAVALVLRGRGRVAVCKRCQRPKDTRCARVARATRRAGDR